MSRLLSIFTSSFQILVQNFVLVWPFFGLMLVFLIIGSLLPENTAPEFSPVWLLVIALMGAILLAFFTGMMAMVHKAVENQVTYDALSEEEKAGTPPDPFQSFALLKEFFPGLGAYYGRFILGSLIHIGIIAVLAIGGQFLVNQLPNAEETFDQIAKLYTSVENQAALTLPQVQQWLLALPEGQRDTLNTMMLILFGGLLLYALISLTTVLWPVLIIAQDCSALAAYGKSIRRFFSDPGRIFAIGLVYLLVQVALNLFFVGLLGQNPLGLSLKQLFSLLSDIWLLLVLFRYALEFMPKPAEDTGSRLSIEA